MLLYNIACYCIYVPLYYILSYELSNNLQMLVCLIHTYMHVCLIHITAKMWQMYAYYLIPKFEAFQLRILTIEY